MIRPNGFNLLKITTPAHCCTVLRAWYFVGVVYTQFRSISATNVVPTIDEIVCCTIVRLFVASSYTLISYSYLLLLYCRAWYRCESIRVTREVPVWDFDPDHSRPRFVFSEVAKHIPYFVVPPAPTIMAVVVRSHSSPNCSREEGSHTYVRNEVGTLPLLTILWIGYLVEKTPRRTIEYW